MTDFLQLFFSGLATGSIYALAALYASRDNSLGELLRTRTAEWSGVLGVPETVLKDYVRHSLTAWPDVLPLAVVQSSEPAGSPLVDIAPWLRYLAQLKAVMQAGFVSRPDLKRLQSGAATLSRADEIRKAWIDYLAGRVHYFSGNPSESLRYYRKVLPIAQRSKKRELLAYPAALVGTALMNQGYADRAEHWLQQSLAPLDQLERNAQDLQQMMLDVMLEIDGVDTDAGD